MSDQDAAKSERVMHAMLQMVKLDIKKLKQAYDGDIAIRYESRE